MTVALDPQSVEVGDVVIAAPYGPSQPIEYTVLAVVIDVTYELERTDGTGLKLLTSNVDLVRKKCHHKTSLDWRRDVPGIKFCFECGVKL